MRVSSLTRMAVVSAALISLLGMSLLLPPVTGSSFTITTCRSNAFFDETSLSCTTCGSIISNRLVDNSSVNMLGLPTRCTCKAGYAISSAYCDLNLAGGCPTDQCSVSCLTSSMAATKDRTTCIACGNSTTGLDLSTGECGCPAGYALTEEGSNGLLLSAKECLPCPSGTRVFAVDTNGYFADRYTCRACPGNDPNAIMAADGSCTCASGYTAATSSLAVAAGAGAGAAAPPLHCLLSGPADAILARYPAVDAATVSFYSVQTTSSGDATGTVRGLVSSTMLSTFAYALVGCRAYRSGGDNVKPCQALANLCVLHLHDPTSLPCSLYAEMAGQRGGGVNSFSAWPITLPFLTWQTDIGAILADTTLSRTMEYKLGTVDGAARQLAFYLAKTSLNGTFLGIDRLRNQLAYCAPESAHTRISADPLWTYFGHGTSQSFTCDIRILASAGEPVFYDMYVRDLSDDYDAADKVEGLNGPSTPLSLFPVPVRIVNYRSTTGKNPNNNAAWSDEGDDVLTSRFTLFDAVTGVRTAGSAPEIIRYATHINLLIRSQTAASDKLAPPILTIQYKERPMAAVYAASITTGLGMATDSLSFSVEYTSDYSRYSSSILDLGASLAVVVLLWATLRITSWVRMNARSQLEAAVGLQHVARWFLFVISTFAFCYFWYLAVATGWWLVYFKLQDSVYSLLPVHRPEYTDDAYTAFATGLWLVWIAYIVRLGEAIHKQVTADIFFVDWEKSRGALFRMGQDIESGIAGRGGGAGAGQQAQLSNAAAGGAPSSASPQGPVGLSGHNFAPISAWRTIFAANEWAELSIMRRTTPALTLLILVLLLEGANLKYVATPQPIAADLTPGSINPALQYANNVFWYLVIVCIQLVYVYFLGERYVSESPATRYVDLCTVMKISVLLMDEKYHGYYLHGNAPHEHADGTMQEIANHLFEEAAATRVGRGLPGCPDPLCQTFEVHVPHLWREQYDRVFRKLLDHESAAVEAAMGGYGAMQMQLQQGGGGGGVVGAGGGVKPGAGGVAGASPLVGVMAKARERTRRLAAASAHLNSFMKGFVEETDPDYKRVWRDRTLLEAAFDVPPDLLNEGMTFSAGAGGGGAGTGSTGNNMTGSRLTHVFTDHRYRFERLTFRGIEWDLLIFEILLFCLVDYLVVSPATAGLSTYVVSEAISQFRRWAGDRNVAYKTLVDARFLV